MTHKKKLIEVALPLEAINRDSHLTGLMGANVKVTLEISADIPEGASDGLVRTVTENARTLKFEPGSGFESE